MERRYLEDAAAEEAVSETMSIVLEKLDIEIRRVWLRSQVIPAASTSAMNRVERLVAWATCTYDGEVTEPEHPLETYSPDEEPAPAPIDTWARGIVPVKKITPKEVDYVTESGLTSARTGSESGTSISSFAKSSVRSKKTSVRGAGDSKPGTPGLGRLEDDSTVGLILELEDDEESITKFDESRKLFKMLQKAKSPTKVSVVSESAGEDEFASLKEAIAKTAKDLKVKKYVVGKDGEVIPVAPVAGEKLPPFLQPMKLTVKNVLTPEEEAAAAAATAKASKDKSKGVKREKGVRVAGAREIEASYFIPSTSLTNSLSTTEPNMVPGTALRSGDVYIEGGDFPEDSKHLSRKAYNHKMSTLSASKILDGPPIIDINKSSDFEAGPSTMTLSVGARESFDALPMSMSLLSSKLLQEDIDPFEGSRKVELSSTNQQAPQKKQLSQRKS